MKRARLYFLFVVLPWFFILGACGTTQVVALDPQLCKPSADLAQVKHLKRVPEMATANDEFYSLFLMERSDHAKDVSDFNGLLRTCVDPTLPKDVPIFGE